MNIWAWLKIFDIIEFVSLNAIEMTPLLPFYNTPDHAGHMKHLLAISSHNI
jgi:hypothetical protein